MKSSVYLVLLTLTVALLLAACATGNEPVLPTPAPTVTASPPPPTSTTAPTAEDPTPVEDDEPEVTETPAPPETTEGHLGDFAKWSKVEVALRGPASEDMSDSANPFAVLLDATFTGPEGDTYDVPGFYAGDGEGGMDGDVWMVRFAPDAVGRWTFETGSDEPLLDGLTGSFDVVPAGECRAYEPGTLPELPCYGRLEYVGEEYLKFAEGPYWVKGGADEPEDFLAEEETVGFETKEAAIDYLAELGVNSLYMLLNNIGGDARNVWPWVGETEAEAQANTDRFDIAKLERWEEVFTHLEENGIALHLVFDDDSAWVGYDREMFYREMVARFGHHNALMWNISEEYNENYTPQQVMEYAEFISELDPYDHPITVHHGETPSYWRYFVGAENIDLTSLQTGEQPRAVNSTAVEFGEAVEESGHVIPIAIDEAAEIAIDMRELSRQVVWAAYLGDANFEMFMSDLQSYEDFGLHLADMTRARKYLESLPFTEMEPANALLAGGQGFVLALPDEVYTVYVLAQRPFELDLAGVSGTFEVSWFDPKTGEISAGEAITAGDVVAFEPPFEGDNVLYLGREPLVRTES